MIKKHVYWKGEISAAHKLDLGYKSKCTQMHGHNYMIEVWVYGETNENGMIIDFSKIKEIVKIYDHKCLNDIIVQPTAENLAKDILNRVMNESFSKVVIRVWEDRDSYAEIEWEL